MHGCGESAVGWNARSPFIGLPPTPKPGMRQGTFSTRDKEGGTGWRFPSRALLPSTDKSLGATVVASMHNLSGRRAWSVSALRGTNLLEREPGEGLCCLYALDRQVLRRLGCSARIVGLRLDLRAYVIF